MRLRRWWAESAPPGWNRVKGSENLGATEVAPVAPVDTSLGWIPMLLSGPYRTSIAPVTYFLLTTDYGHPMKA